MISILRTEEWALGKYKPDERDIARHNDPETIRLLGLDILSNGLLHPVLAVEDGRMISGHGRLLAARSAGIQTLLTNVYPASLTQTQIKLLRAAENLQRRDYTPYQKYVIAAELMAENPSWNQKGLCEHMHLSEGMISKLLSPAKCIPALQAALKLGKVGLTECAAASKLSAADQAEFLEFKHATGANRDQMEAFVVTKKRGPAKNTVKLDRVKLALAGRRMRVGCRGTARHEWSDRSACGGHSICQGREQRKHRCQDAGKGHGRQGQSESKLMDPALLLIFSGLRSRDLENREEVQSAERLLTVDVTMPSQSLIHDYAMKLAAVSLEVVTPCLREEEQREAFNSLYDACIEVLRQYEKRASRMERRVRPSNN